MQSNQKIDEYASVCQEMVGLVIDDQIAMRNILRQILSTFGIKEIATIMGVQI